MTVKLISVYGARRIVGFAFELAREQRRRRITLGHKAAIMRSAPDIAGRGLANPVATILSGAMLLRHIGEHGAADAVVAAVGAVLAGGRGRTPDLGGQASTQDMARAVAKAL